MSGIADITPPPGWIISQAVADVIRERYGELPPGVIVTVLPPARWPLDLPWPPQVTVPGPPCWGCVTRPSPERAAVNRYFTEHPLGPLEW